MASATVNLDVVRDYLATKCVEGYVMGLFNPDDFPLVYVSQFGVNPKRVMGKWCLIVDLFSPEGGSVGNVALCPLSYMGVEEAA